MIRDKIIDNSIFYVFSEISGSVIETFLKKYLNEGQEYGESTDIIDSILDYLEEGIFLPKVIDALINVFFETDMNERYPENSFYAGQSRFDRFLNAYRNVPAIRIWIKDQSLTETLDEIIEEIEEAERKNSYQ